MDRRKLFIALIAGLICPAIHAGGVCELEIRPTTSGFFLNPTLEKVLVHKATPKDAEQPCAMVAGDELLQINEQVIPGRRAKEVMKYWKGLPKQSPRTFKVRREGEIITITSGQKNYS